MTLTDQNLMTEPCPLTGGYAPITRPAPAAVPAGPAEQRPIGDLQDLAYRWSARIALLGHPNDGDGRRPVVLTLGADGVVAHEPLPLPLFARHPERGVILVGQVEALWFNPDGPHGPEVCAQGTFDLGQPDAPRLAVELRDAAAKGQPLVATPMMSSIRYADEPEGATGAQTAITWTIKDLFIAGSAPTWPGCVILPDDFQTAVHLGGRSYPMRTLYDSERWRALKARLTAAEQAEAGSPADRLLAGLALVFAAMTSADRDDLGARLLDDNHPLTLTEVVDGAGRIAQHLDAQADRYRSAGGGR